jgi:uncharacterized membrane protein YidH (DUF202 family)
MWFISIAHAAQPGMNATQFALKIAQVIGNPIILFLMAFALLTFVWGIAEYIRGSDSDSERETGRQHMIWGLVGLFIMTAAFSILQMLVDTVYRR